MHKHSINKKKLDMLKVTTSAQNINSNVHIVGLLCSSESTNFKQQSFLRNSSSAGQEIPHILMTPAGSVPYSPEPATCPNPETD